MPTELEVLEAEVKDKLLGFDTTSRTTTGAREERVLRSGAFRAHPVRISAPARRHRSRQYGLTVDQAAHMLSALPPELAASLSGRVREVTLLPEFTPHRESVLTHVFFPTRGLLAFYLFPNRLLEAPAERYPERFRPEQATSVGMLPALVRTLAGAMAPRETRPEYERLLKFLIPRDLILPGEVQAMQEIHDRYQHPTLA